MINRRITSQLLGGIRAIRVQILLCFDMLFTQGPCRTHHEAGVLVVERYDTIARRDSETCT